MYLIPIFLTGIIILRKICRIKRAELLLPAGSILGFVVFTFFLNMTAFLVKGSSGIIVAYVLFIALGFVIFKFIKSENVEINFPGGGNLIFWLTGILIWASFIFWKTANALIGSDVNLYYAIAHSFIKGNFPFLTPWQPDIPLSYHTGVSELLGAFFYFSGLDFQFLHLFFSALFIFCALQIIIWIIIKKHNLTSFFLSNLAAAVTFLSFGFIYITWSVFPVKFPVLPNINELVIWLRNLPTVNQAIEVYGAPINLDALIYFIFHAFGIAIFFLLLVILLEYEKVKSSKMWVLNTVILAVLALVNEGLFIAAFPAVIFSLRKSLKRIIFFSVLTFAVVSFQGGIISASLNQTVNLETSAVIFPKKNDIKEDFNAYHAGQEKSKLLPLKSQWLPLRWFHPGVEVLLVVCIFAIFITKNNLRIYLLTRILFIAGLSSLLAYNIIVPKFLIANGNRFLSAAFLFLALLLCLSLPGFFEKIKKHIFFKILFLIIVAWIFLPTILPPLALLSKQRFGESKLIPESLQGSHGIEWLKDNIGLKERVMVLDKNAPHPSGQVRAMVEAGVFAPVFAGNFRAFTVEASPEYVDVVYYLSPHALKKLNINILLVDDIFLKTLPDIRKQQLQDNKYFERIFHDVNNENSETIYRIKEVYFKKGQEIDGTFEEMLSVLPVLGKIYIDNEENFDPSFLRRPIIFSIRDRDLYYLPQSGVYLNVESDINSHPPREDYNYDYLFLGKNTNPRDLCKCQTELIWTGLRGQVFLWKVNR